MTQNEKDILLKDLCGRIMCGVKCTVYEYTNVQTLSGVIPNSVYKELYFDELDWKEYDGFADVQYCKPYLFPLSSMTNEQKEELDNMFNQEDDIYEKIKTGNFEFSFYRKSIFDFLNKHHLDWRGLIPMGLALDATNLNIY